MKLLKFYISRNKLLYQEIAYTHVFIIGETKRWYSLGEASSSSVTASGQGYDSESKEEHS